MKRAGLTLLFAISLTSILLAQQGGSYFVTVADANNTQDADTLVSTLSQAGYTCNRVADSQVYGLYHVRVGPYASQGEADKVRASFIAAGYHLPGSGGAPAAAQQSSLEAEALANLGGSANSGPPATGADLEAQALQSMQTNEVEAEQQQQRAMAQQEADNARRAAEQAQAAAEAPPERQESGAVTFLKALNGALGQVNDSLEQQNAAGAQRIAQQQAQINAQVAANNARRAQQAEAQRQAAARVETARQAPQPHAPATTAATSTAGTVVPAPTPAPTPSQYVVDYGTGPGSYPTPAGYNSGGSAPPNSPTNSKPGGDYAGSMDHCVSMAFLPASFNGMPSDMYLTFTNHCPSTVYIKYFVGQQNPAGTYLRSEEVDNQTGWTETNFNNLHQGDIGYYACPEDHPNPVDAKGNSIITRGAAYQCAKSY